MRTQKVADSYEHLRNSLKIVQLLEEKVRTFDYALQAQCIAERNYERLEMYVLEHLMRG
jgi:xylose isomerase